MQRPTLQSASLSQLAKQWSAAPALGCRAEPVGLVTDRTAPSASSALSAPFDAARFDPPAKAFVAEVLAYAETCNLKAEEPTGWFDFINYDICSTEPQDFVALFAAKKAFDDATEKMTDMPLPAQALGDQIRIFDTWIEGVSKIRVSRGTMRVYQGLALALNAYAPEAKMPTEPKHALDQYFVAYPVRGVAYIWEQVNCYDPVTFRFSDCSPTSPYVRMDRYAIHRKRGTPLVWRSSPQGPYLAE